MTSSRRGVVQAVAVLLLGAMSVAACGDDSDEGAPATEAASTSAASSAVTDAAEAPADDVDREGTIKIGMSFAGFSPDATMVPNVTSSWIAYLVQGTLLRMNVDGSIEPWLAKSATIVDPRTIEVELQPGRTYQDGTPFNAENVKAGVERNFASPLAAGAFLDGEYKSLESIEVTGDLTFTIHLNADVAGAFYLTLTKFEWATTSPSSPTFAEYPNNTPVGAGPYKLVSFTPDESLVLERWEESPDADAARIKQVEAVALTPDAYVNALRTGVVDYITPISYLAAEELASDSSVHVDYTELPDWAGVMYINCKRHEGWSDPLVRRAFSLAVNRDRLSETMFGGRAVPLDTFLTEQHPLFNPAVKGMNTRDIDQAKALLAEAGYADGITLTLMITGGDAFGQRAAEVVQSDVAEAGITIEIETTANIVQDMFIDRKGEALIALSGVSHPGISSLTSTYLGSNGNSCDVGKPAPDGTPPTADEERMVEVINELRALDPESEDIVPLWYEAQELATENAWLPALLSPPQIRAYTDNVGDPADMPLPANYGPDVMSMYIKN